MALLGYNRLGPLAVAKFLTDPIWYFYLYWLPKFFDERYHLGLSQHRPAAHCGLQRVGHRKRRWRMAATAFNKAGMSIAKARMFAMLVCACLILPIFISSQLSSLLVRGRHSQPGHRRASGLVCESLYHRLRYVPAQFRRSCCRYRWHGRLAGFRLIFVEYWMGSAISSRLRAVIFRGRYLVSRWTFIPAVAGARPKKSPCAKGVLSATREQGPQ